MIAGRRQLREVFRPANAAFGDRGHVARQPGRDRVEHAEVHAQRPQVPAVDAHESRARIQRALQLGNVVHFDQRRKPKTLGSAEQPPQILLLQRPDDEQRGVRAEHRRLQQLVLRDDEVLAEEREIDRGPDVAEVLRIAVEERRLGEHGNRRRAGVRVRARVRGRIVIGSRRMPLDGDRRLHSAITRGALPPVPLPVPGPRSARSNSAPHGVRVCSRARTAAGFAASRTCTIRRVAATIVASRSAWAAAVVMTPRPSCPRSRPRRACRGHRPRAPLSSAAPARWMPSAIVVTSPAISSDAAAFSATMSRGAPVFAAEDRAGNHGVLGGISAAQGLGRRLRHAEIQRVHVERVHGPLPALRDLRVAGRRDLVEAVGPVHDPRALGPEERERPRDELGQLRPRHADELPRRAGRVRQRAEQVEGRADAEIAARRPRHGASTGETSARRRTRSRPPRDTARRREARR